jgi:hypothetical protein
VRAHVAGGQDQAGRGGERVEVGVGACGAVCVRGREGGASVVAVSTARVERGRRGVGRARGARTQQGSGSRRRGARQRAARARGGAPSGANQEVGPCRWSEHWSGAAPGGQALQAGKRKAAGGASGCQAAPPLRERRVRRAAASRPRAPRPWGSTWLAMYMPCTQRKK